MKINVRQGTRYCTSTAGRVKIPWYLYLQRSWSLSTDYSYSSSRVTVSDSASRYCTGILQISSTSRYLTRSPRFVDVHSSVRAYLVSTASYVYCRYWSYVPTFEEYHTLIQLQLHLRCTPVLVALNSFDTFTRSIKIPGGT